jgi:phosphoenolpyruvate synthase/pyruvate phosphate dikinase
MLRNRAKFSMPGMMETALNIGLSDESVHGLAKQAGSKRFAPTVARDSGAPRPSAAHTSFRPAGRPR